jgi:hypothetical protein
VRRVVHDGGVLRPWRLWQCCRSTTSCMCSRGLGSGRKPCGGGVLGRRSPHWGRHSGATLCCAWSLGENPVLLGRVTVAPLVSFPPWRRCLLRSRSSVVMSVPCHGCFGRWDNSVMRRTGRGLPSSRLKQQLSHWCRGSPYCCSFVYLQRNAAAGIDAIASAVRDNVD